MLRCTPFVISVLSGILVQHTIGMHPWSTFTSHWQAWCCMAYHTFTPHLSFILALAAPFAFCRLVTLSCFQFDLVYLYLQCHLVFHLYRFSNKIVCFLSNFEVWFNVMIFRFVFCCGQVLDRVLVSQKQTSHRVMYVYKLLASYLKANKGIHV